MTTSHHPGSWDHYRTALAVMEEGSLSGAARALGLTQPTIGRQVEALEKSLGVRLFTRSRLGLAPTEAASILRSYAQTFRVTDGAIRRAVTATPDAIAGAVRISASEIVGAEVLPDILAALRASHPKLQIELVLTNRTQDLLSREADVAIRMHPPAQKALLARRIGSVELGAFAHRRYLAGRPPLRDVKQLRNEALIGFDTPTAFLRGFRLGKLALHRTMFALRTDSDLAQLAMIRAGFGVGICQVPLGRRDPQLVRVLADSVCPQLPVWTVMHENLRDTARYRTVFDALGRGLKAYLAPGTAR